MVDVAGVLTRWALDVRQVRDRMYRAPTPRERERWHALWLPAQGWSASKVAEVLERDAHTIGGWLAAFERDRPATLAGLKVAVQATPGEVGIALANWNWKVVRQFIEARCGVRLCRSACTRYLHRLGFAYKRPKKRLLKADEAHFRADGDLHGKWVLKGMPALVDSSYYSAVCLETGEKAHMELTGTSSSATSAAFLTPSCAAGSPCTALDRHPVARLRCNRPVRAWPVSND